MGNSFSLSGDAFMPAWNCLIVRKFGSSNSQVYPLQVWQAARRLLLWLYCSVLWGYFVIMWHCWEQETERPVIFGVHWQRFVKASLPDSWIGWLKHFPMQAFSNSVTTLEHRFFGSDQLIIELNQESWNQESVKKWLINWFCLVPQKESKGIS